MLIDEQRNRLRYVAAKAYNTWGIGGEDIMLTFEFAPELKARFEINNHQPSPTIYVDLSIENALEFAESLIAALEGAIQIDTDYRNSQA